MWRAVLLIVLSNLLSNWNSSSPPRLQLINVLCQIALGYVMCFLVMQLRFRWQVVAGFALMALHQALFFSFPGSSGSVRSDRQHRRGSRSATSGVQLLGLLHDPEFHR